MYSAGEKVEQMVYELVERSVCGWVVWKVASSVGEKVTASVAWTAVELAGRTVV